MKDISHGKNHEKRSVYSISSPSDPGKPIGIRLVNNCSNRIQGNKSHGFSSGDNAVRQPVKVGGKSNDISHSPRKLSTAVPTPASRIHPKSLRYCHPNDVDTDEKIDLLLQASYPKEAYGKRFGYETVKEYEKIAISILETCIPPELPLQESNKFTYYINLINTWRAKQGIPCFPSNMLEFEIHGMVKRYLLQLFSARTGILRAICYNAEFLQNFCSLYPFQTMKTVRLRLNLVEGFLNDPLVIYY